jgi:autotransporter-associated beta strand protein
MSDRKHGLRPCAVAFAVALALGLSGCGGGGGGGGGGANVKPTPPPPPVGGSNFAGGNVNVDAGNTTVWPADIGGSIDLVKVGAGALVLTGTDSYTGGTTISAGTLQLGSGGMTGVITGDVIDNGSLVFDRSDNVTFPGIVSGNGSLTQAGTGTLSLTGNSTYTGGTAVSAGTLQLGSGGTTGSIVGDAMDNGSLVFDRSDNVTFPGVVSGNGSLTQAGTGTLTLTGSNTYTGATTINAGTLALTGTGSIASSSGVSDAGTLDISGTSSGATIKSLSGSGVVTLGAQTLTLSNATDTFGGVIGGTGGLKLAGGTEILSGVDTYAGGTIISAGTLQLGNGGTSGSVIGNVMDNGTLAFNQSGNVSYGGIVSGAGSLTQLGSGTLTLASANTYTGATTINAGTLALTGSGGVASSSGVSDAGTFDISGTSSGATITSLSGSGTVTLGAQTLTLSNAANTFGGVIGGTGGLTLAGGTEILTGANAYSGATTIGAGTLQLGNGGSTGSIAGDVTDNGALVFDHIYSAGISGLVSSNISGSGSLTQAGAGTLILTGNNTYTGGTTISNGTLQLSNFGTTGAIVGNVTDNGVLVFNRTDNVAFSGTVSGSGSLTQAGTGTLILTGNNTYAGDTTISGGNLQLGDGGTAGSIVGNVTNIGYNSSLVFDRSDDWSYGGIVSGSGGLVKMGNDTLAMTGANTYTGPTTVEAGTLKIAAGGALGFTTISVTNATFEIDAGATVSGSAALGAGAVLDNAGIFFTKFAGSSAAHVTSLNAAVTVVNHDGGLIEGDSTQAGLNIPAILLGTNSILTNDAGSTIKGPAGVSTSGVVNNAGGSIVGIFYDGVDGAASVNNSAGGLIASGTGAGPFNIGVMTSVTNAVVGNTGGSYIKGGLDGVWLGDGGTVTNDGGSTISGNTGVSIDSMSSATGIVNNTGGSTISGARVGIDLEYGGTITNGPGSTIETAAIASGDCSSALTCAIYVPIYSAYGSYGSNGELNFTNAGVVVGDVQMDPSAINTVTLVAGGSINGYLNIGSNTQSTLTLDGGAGATQSYSNAVSGATTFGGDLIKNGDGTWVIDNAGLQGVVNTSINAGSLQATQVLSGAVSVNAPGKLDGVPGVAGNLSNAGTVAVHGGDTTVGGNYTQVSTGTLAVSLGSKLAVTGTAALSGGTLEVTGADSGYVANTHTNVLAATGGLTGTFAQLIKDTGVVFTSTSIQYDANSAWLDTTGLNVTTAAAGAGVSYTPASMNSALRVQAAFVQLDSRIATNNLSGVSSNFLQAAGQFQQAPTLQAAQASLQSLSGELHAASAAMTFEAIDASSRALSDRFDQLLGKGGSFGVWTQSLDMGGNMARTGYDGVGFQLNGWLVGSDRQIGHSGVAGFAFGQSQGLQQAEQGFGRDNSRSTESMVYAGWLNGSWYTQGRVGFGHFQQDVNRQVLLGYSMQGVSTRYNGNYSVAYGESGLYVNYGGTRIAPFADVEYASIDRGGFIERGAGGFGLQSDAQTVDRWQAGLGVRASRHWNLDDGRAVDFSARAQWQRTLASRGDVFDASFVGLQQWQPLTGIGLSRYSGLFGVGVDAMLSSRTTLNFGYDYEVGQRDSAQMLSARLNVAL